MNVILLLLSLTGFLLACRWFRKELHPSFYPALTVSIISVIVCLGGMAGALRETVSMLFFAGLLSLAVFGFLCLRKDFREKNPGNHPFLWMLCAFLLFCACSAFLLRNRFLYAYDDFSHWGLVAGILLKQGRFPTGADGLMFPSYPLGSASFICFCGKALGSDAEACLLAQNIMLISFLIPLQSAAGKKPVGYLLTTAAIPLFIFYNTPIDTLSVDNLLGAVLLAALLLYFHHDRASGRTLPDLAILLACCVLIKNSGLFLALGLVLLAVLRGIRSGIKIRTCLLWLFLPFLVYLAWRVHLKTGFSDFGKHYMSLSAYYGTFRRKLGEIGLILQVILPILINPLRNHVLLLFPAFALVYFAADPERRKKQREMIGICAAFFVLYEAGVLVMYICSMGTGELISQNGADYPRYNGTVICVLAGILMLMSGRLLLNLKLPQNGKQSLAALAALMITIGCMCMNMAWLKPLEENREAYPDACAFSEITQNRLFGDGQEIAVLFRNPDPSDYEAYMAAYYLYPAKNIKFCKTPEEMPEPETGITRINLRESEKTKY